MRSKARESRPYCRAHHSPSSIRYSLSVSNSFVNYNKSTCQVSMPHSLHSSNMQLYLTILPPSTSKTPYYSCHQNCPPLPVVESAAQVSVTSRIRYGLPKHTMLLTTFATTFAIGHSPINSKSKMSRAKRATHVLAKYSIVLMTELKPHKFSTAMHERR